MNVPQFLYYSILIRLTAAEKKEEEEDASPPPIAMLALQLRFEFLHRVRVIHTIR